MNDHRFCRKCGCTTYGISPEYVDFKPHPTQKKVGVNARLLDVEDLESWLKEVQIDVIDGKNLW